MALLGQPSLGELRVLGKDAESSVSLTHATWSGVLVSCPVITHPPAPAVVLRSD